MSGARLAQWLVAQGGFVSDAVAISEGPRGRFLRASRDAAPSELMLRVPLAAAIAPELGRQVLRDAGVAGTSGLADEVLLAAYVAEHLAGETSNPHSTWVEALPSLDSLEREIPLFWEQADGSQGASWPLAVREAVRRDAEAAAVLRGEIGGLQAAVEAERARLRPHEGLPRYSKQAFKHAWAVVMSRNFLVKHTALPGRGECLLLPFGDLLNHGGPGVGGECLRWAYNATEDTVDFVACRRIVQGEELLINYSRRESGRRPLEQDAPFHFLLCYGFLEQETAGETAEQRAAAPDARNAKL